MEMKRETDQSDTRRQQQRRAMGKVRTSVYSSTVVVVTFYYFVSKPSRITLVERVHGVIPCLMSQKLSSVLGEVRAYLGRPQSQKVTFGNSVLMILLFIIITVIYEFVLLPAVRAYTVHFHVLFLLLPIQSIIQHYTYLIAFVGIVMMLMVSNIIQVSPQRDVVYLKLKRGSIVIIRRPYLLRVMLYSVPDVLLYGRMAFDDV